MAMNVYHCDRCDEVYAIVIPIAVGAMSDRRRLEVETEIQQRKAAHLAARHNSELEEQVEPGGTGTAGAAGDAGG